MSENVLNNEELEQVSGGTKVTESWMLQQGKTYATHVDTGYLALRRNPVYDDGNIIGRLWNTSYVRVDGAVSGSYVSVVVVECAPDQWGGPGCKYANGWVNWTFLETP